ncbi:helix-turn-helix domain-containing protein [Sedimenticola hydrogenitrophicus]|uniref:helix-turn-helix domain-containing protein n=1 Tax=Sedimenticola hydrogenitrophicus TaxID=2967975 RepID=UPI0023AF4C72
MDKKQLVKLIQNHESAEAGIGERVRTLRMANGLTQGQLGDLAGSNKAAIQKIEIGKSMRPRCLAALAAVLGVNPAWLAWGAPYASPEIRSQSELPVSVIRRTVK